VEIVRAMAAEQPIISFSAEQVVVLLSPQHPVGTGATHPVLAARPAEERVGSCIPKQLVRAVASAESVVARATVDDVTTRAAFE